jgi:GNAT superfamily N-acetyltransferase
MNSGAASPATAAKQEAAYGALYGAFAASQATSLKKQPLPPAATISHTPVSDRDAQFTVYAEVDGQRVGQATFEPTLHGDDAMITMIHVHEDFRRRGIAQQMWEKAKELGFEPVHSLRRKPDGEAFAAAVGGPTPPNLALITPDMPAEERQALNAAVWDWYASRPAKRLPRHLQGNN